MTTKTQSTEEMVNEEWNHTAERLEDSTPSEILDEVLELKREQAYVEDRWQTTEYVLVLTVGGPHIEVKTNGKLSVHWSGESKEMMLNEDGKDTLNEVYQHLQSMYL
jgi:hypothetical protein